MFDSFKCLKTFDKLRIRKNKGLFYHGSTYIEKENITKLKEEKKKLKTYLLFLL